VAESSSLALAARHQSWPGSRHQLNASQSSSAARRLREITCLGIGQQTDWSLQGTPIVVLSRPETVKGSILQDLGFGELLVMVCGADKYLLTKEAKPSDSLLAT
jgi:hypothetical protein